MSLTGNDHHAEQIKMNPYTKGQNKKLISAFLGFGGQICPFDNSSVACKYIFNINNLNS